MNGGAVQVSRMLSPVTALGPGRRLGLWVQGCALACRGCASTDTWDRSVGTNVPVVELADSIAESIRREGLAGLTITGGEPIDQASSLAQLVDQVRGIVAGIDVLVFTGYSPAAARRRGPGLWDRADTVVAGPYRRDLPSDDPILASSNQVLIHRTQLGRRRFAEEPPRRHLQVLVDGSDVQLVGLPRPGDLERWRTLLDARGVHLPEVSWLR